jgi:hypothetical protein
MAEVSAFPARGGVLFDTRDEGRALRVSWHPGDQLVVLSMWRADRCVATCHLAPSDAAALVAQLASGLAALPAALWSQPTLTG